MQTVIIDNTKEWTVEDYLSLEQTNKPCELINGELVMSPAPSLIHQIILSNLNDVLKSYAKQTDAFTLFSPVDVFFDTRNVFQPDLFFIKKENRSILSERGIEGAPDLVVEIISPSNSYKDRYEKKIAYQKFGVKEYWIIDPGNKTLEIYTSTQEDQDTPQLYLAEEGLVTSTVLPQLQFNLKEIF